MHHHHYHHVVVILLPKMKQTFWCCFLFLTTSSLLWMPSSFLPSILPFNNKSSSSSSSSSFAAVAFAFSSSSSSYHHYHHRHLQNHYCNCNLNGPYNMKCSRQQNYFRHHHQQQRLHHDNPKNIAFFALQVSSSSSSSSDDDDTNNNFNNNNNVIDNLEFTSALCIIPPIWDRIQRARHYARDSLFHTWPPAIRLFHPFGFNNGQNNNNKVTPFDVAQAIDELEIEPFEITFNNDWVIIPHYESIQQELFTSQNQPSMEDHIHMQQDYYQESNEEMEVRQLIEREERLAKIAYLKRQDKKRRKEELDAALLEQQQQQAEEDEEDDDERSGYNSNNTNMDKDEEEEEDEEEDNDDDDNDKAYSRKTSSDELSPYDMYQSQQQFYEEAGSLGPCLLCLEPDEESKLKLIELRETLQEFLNIEPDYFSPSSCYNFGSSGTNSGTTLNKQLIHPELYDMGYRPLLPIGGIFESFPIAMETARRLKGLWGDDNPLTFTVNELHVISCFEDEEAAAVFDDNNYNDDGGDFGVGSDGDGGSNDNPLFMIQRQQQERQYASIPWGCNAKIMLFGQEMEQDDEFNQEQVNKLVEEGIAGGNDLSEDITILEDEEDEPTMSDLELWLNDDDDFDEGIQLMIGRTTFYTGDQRTFKQMPVSSVVDHKDLALGENPQKVSAVARRRRTSSRQTNAFEDGEYGRRDIDYLPWTKHQRKNRDRNSVRSNDFTKAGGRSSSSTTNDDFASSSFPSIPYTSDDDDGDDLEKID